MVKKTKLEFLALPQSEAECVAVDMEHGLWIQCGICDSTRNPLTNRPYNMIMVKDNSPSVDAAWKNGIGINFYFQQVHVA